MAWISLKATIVGIAIKDNSIILSWSKKYHIHSPIQAKATTLVLATQIETDSNRSFVCFLSNANEVVSIENGKVSPS